MMRPSSSRDTEFFWEGVNAHELRIQRRPDGSLQHPPVPAVWQDANKVAPSDYLVASGKGTVFSFVVHHAPKVPGRTLPFVIALVELEEGVRMLGELRNVDHAKVKIGMPVRATYIDFPADDTGPEWTLYAWEPVSARVSAPSLRKSGTTLPELKLYGDPDVHHLDGHRHARLPGRPPRPRQGAGQGIEGHLRQHPDRHRAGAALRHRLGWAEGADQVDRAAARCAVVRLRHGDILR